MKILFYKIGYNTKPFYLEENGVSFIGELHKSGYHRLQLIGDIKGNIELFCNRCGDSLNYTLEIPLKLTISDQIIEDKVDLDIIEFLDGDIDISFILNSEINTLKSEYLYCQTCSKIDNTVEIEF
ncbi:MAG: hypothetical protein JJV88_02220 [Sulfurovum sp.]|nr:hypothetical protein [Sulfurovaceae bacterium]